MTDHDAFIVLNMIQGVGPARMTALLQACGSAGAIFERNADDLAQISGIGPALADRIARWQEYVDLQQELNLAEKGGVHIVVQSDPDYPAILKQIHDPPLCLYVRGSIPDDLQARSIAMVGTRNLSQYGAQMAQHLAEAAGYAGWTVVSGLAVGIDTVAHSSVLNTPAGRTVAVLGGGLMRLHPQENLALARRITEHGAVISEFPMRFSPTRSSFPRRNRIISGLALGTLVVEAGLNSGSLITAAQALEQGRRVFAVPGQADHVHASGCNRLIREGAVLVETFEHVLQEFDFLPGFEPPVWTANEPPRADFLSDADGLSSLDSSILERLQKGPAGVDELSTGLEAPASDILSSLIALELLSRIKKNNDGRYTRLR